MALWKGLLPPVVASTPMYALCFFGYGVGKKLFCDKDAFEEGNFKLGQIGMAGAFSAVFTTPVMAPQERLKCVLQTQKVGADGKLPSMSQVAKQLYKEGGLTNLLRGSGVTVLRDASASFMYFTTYEVMKYKMRQFSSNGELHLGHFIIAGGIAGIMNWVRRVSLIHSLTHTTRIQHDSDLQHRYPPSLSTCSRRITKQHQWVSIRDAFWDLVLFTKQYLQREESERYTRVQHRFSFVHSLQMRRVSVVMSFH